MPMKAQRLAARVCVAAVGMLENAPGLARAFVLRAACVHEAVVWAEQNSAHPPRNAAAALQWLGRDAVDDVVMGYHRPKVWREASPSPTGWPLSAFQGCTLSGGAFSHLRTVIATCTTHMHIKWMVGQRKSHARFVEIDGAVFIRMLRTFQTHWPESSRTEQAASHAAMLEGAVLRTARVWDLLHTMPLGEMLRTDEAHMNPWITREAWRDAALPDFQLVLDWSRHLGVLDDRPPELDNLPVIAPPSASPSRARL